jgi:hypothetical protein
MELTPKEKAEELIIKFTFNTRCYSETKGWEDYLYDAKQCALIAIDEILSYDIRAKCESQFIIEQRIESYWKQVKQEINNL